MVTHRPVYWGAFDAHHPSADASMRDIIATRDRPGTVWRVELSEEPTRAHPHGIRHLYAWVPVEPADTLAPGRVMTPEEPTHLRRIVQHRRDLLADR